MNQNNQVNEDTLVQPDETKELIERLSDPSFTSSLGQATVKDIAETLDMDSAKVMAGLKQIREERALQFAHNDNSQRETLSARNNRLAITVVLASLLIMAISFFFLFQAPPSIAPPTPVPTERTPPPTGDTAIAPPAPR